MTEEGAADPLLTNYTTPTKMKIRVLSIVFMGCALLAASPLPGQSADTVPAYDLEGVTATVTRTTVDPTRVPQRLEVIDAGVLDLTPATHAAEALRRTAAVDVIDFPGLLTGVSMRGFRPQYSGVNPRVLLLRDGRPAGTANLALLPLADVERIEVLRGPASSLYGSSAMGGVINVVTRRSAGVPGGAAHVAYGSHGAYEARLSAGGVLTAALDFDLAGSTVGHHDGYRTGSNRTFAADSLLKTLPDGSTTRLPWVTADTVLRFAEYAARTGSARIGWKVSERWRLEGSGEVYRGDDVQNPGDLSVPGDGRSLKDVGRHSGALVLSGSGARSTQSLRLFTAHESIDYYRAPERPTYVNYRTPVRSSGAQLQSSWNVGQHELTLGADYLAVESESEAFTESGEAAAPYTPNSATHSLAGFARAHLHLLDDRLNVSGGARLDRVGFHIRDTPNLGGYPANSETHVVVSPNLGARFEFAPGLQLYGNIGRGFVSPDAFNVAGYSESRAGDGQVYVTRGNPQLRPESARTYEAGIALRGQGPVRLDVAYFHTNLRDRITSRTTVPGVLEITTSGDTIVSVTSYLNADGAAMRGLEADASVDLGWLRDGLGLFATATRIFVAEERLTGTDSSEPIMNVADLTLVAGAEFDAGRRLAGRLSGRYVGKRVDTDYADWQNPGRIDYPPYLVFDLATTLRLHDRYRLHFEGRNLLDEDYFEVRGYNLPGRAVRLGASVSF